MPKGYCLSIGLNSVDPASYDGWSGNLTACENDAKAIGELAKSRGYDVNVVLTSAATSTRILSELSRLSKTLVSGDILLLYYSGHGGQVGDVNLDEQDSLDETWCLFDRMLIDDELNAMFSQFSAGVRILVLSDSCHSGTATKELQYAELQKLEAPQSPERRRKAIPFDASWKLYRSNKSLYDSIQFVAGSKDLGTSGASVILISGCQDNQLSADGNPNSLFTAVLLEVWNGGSFSKNYKQFHSAIVKEMPPFQTPNYYLSGKVNLEFEAQVPFTI